jgi:hypothetical protein
VKQDTSPSRRSQISYQILAYLADHPQAQDTVEGIVEWWLLEQRIKQATSQVKTALEQLISKDLVVARKDKTGRVYFRVNREMIREIRRMLRAENKKK